MSVDAYLEALKTQTFFADETREGSVRWNINWYKRRAPLMRTLFRVIGFLSLLLSITLPFAMGIAPTPEVKQTVTLVLAYLIALAGALNGFFQWNRSWQGYLETQLTLERLQMEWELGIAAYRGKTDNASLLKVQDLTLTFVSAARAAITAETKAYFEEVKFPTLSASPPAS
jgi:hypothetical protein